MWQALFAAAVAGSTGIVAKRLFKRSSDRPPKPSDDGELRDQRISGSDRESESQVVEGENKEVFKFSSSGSMNSRKKKKGDLGRRTKEGARVERSTGLDQRNGNSRRFCVSLKRRKVCRGVAGNRSASCSSQDTSLFGVGLGVGMMCMMSAGKAEFSKLNEAVSETTKIVQELKSEIHKRKSSPDIQVVDSHPNLNDSIVNESDGIKSFSPHLVNDVDCGSSGLTEEPVMEMDQLEAELELELQKLPWCDIEASNQDDNGDLHEKELSAQGFTEKSELCGNGILAEELDQKLCHMLIERQENQIEELESELTLSQRKLHQKEAELQALKDCVKRLTEVSLSTFSDEEQENNKKVGMKRPIIDSPCSNGHSQETTTFYSTWA